MTQESVLKLLVKNKNKWFSSSEVCKSLNISIGSALHNLMRLRKSGFVNFKPTGNGFLYKYKG